MNTKRWAGSLVATMAAGLLVWGCSESADPGDSGESLAGSHAGGTENGAAGGAGLGGGGAGSGAETEPMECKGSLALGCSRHPCPASVDTFAEAFCSPQPRFYPDMIEQWETTCGTKVILASSGADAENRWYYFDDEEQLVAVVYAIDAGACEYGAFPCGHLNRRETKPTATLCSDFSSPAFGGGGQGWDGSGGGQSTPVACGYFCGE